MTTHIAGNKAAAQGPGISGNLTVLLADADPAARHVLRRVLLREFKSTVIEADNGISVLEGLDTMEVDALVLDLLLPGLSGLDVLRDIRRSNRRRSMPVLVITERRDEEAIKEAVTLGVSDYVLKDQHPAVIVERMRRVFSSERTITQARAQTVRRNSTPTGAFTILVVDEDLDFQHFCTDIFRSKYEVTTTSSGAHALSLTLAQPPNAILVGHGIGTMSQESFARRIRQVESATDVRLVGVVPKPRLREVTDLGVFDCVAVKSFVPETFLLQFEQTLRPPGILNKVAAAMPGFRSQAISAVEQVFGMMLGTEVNVLAEAPASPPDGVSLFVPITIAEQNADILVGACVSHATGLALAGRMLQSPKEDLPEDAASSSLAEILNMVSGRVQHGLNSNGMRAQIGLPTPSVPGLGSDDDMRFGFAFDSLEGEPQEFSISIAERETQVSLAA